MANYESNPQGQPSLFPQSFPQGSVATVSPRGSALARTGSQSTAADKSVEYSATEQTARHLPLRLRAHAFSLFLATGKAPTLHTCHKCDVPLCVRPDHLFEGTAADNLHDMYSKGRGGDRRNFGERNAKSKLTAEKARQIKDKYAAGARLSDLGREYGIAPSSVSAIVRGKNWASA